MTPLPAGKDGPCGKPPKKCVVLLSRWLQVLPEAHFAPNEARVEGGAPGREDRQTGRGSFWSRLEILD